MLPIRVWTPTRHGPFWLSRREPTSSLLGLGHHGLFDQLVGDMETHLEEMAPMRESLLLAYPLLTGDSEGRMKPRQKTKSLARRAGKEPVFQDQGKEKFQLSMDVRGFSPEELTVRTDGRKLTVTGKQEKKTESVDGVCSQEYRALRRETLLPENVDVQAVLCSLSQDGQLCIEAPHLALPPSEERVIPISVCQAVNAGEGKVTMQQTEPGSSQMETGGEGTSPETPDTSH